MKHTLTFFSRIFFALLLPAVGFSQSTSDSVEMADVMRSNGKIYVVVGVLLIIFFGLAFYLISIDRKVRKLENRNK